MNQKQEDRCFNMKNFLDHKGEILLKTYEDALVKKIRLPIGKSVEQQQ